MRKKILLNVFRHLRETKRSAPDRALAGVLAIGAIGIFLWGAYHVWDKVADRAAASLLPAEKTSLYLEVEDSNLPMKLRGSELEKLFKAHPVLTLLGVDSSALPAWAREDVGLAMVDGHPVLFFRSGTRRQALRYLKTMALAEEKLQNRGSDEYPVYIYPQSQNFAFSFAGPYLFVSEDAGTLAAIYGVLQNQIPSLEKSADFAKAFLNLPKNTWARGYANLELLEPPAGVAGAWIGTLKSMASKLSWTVKQASDGFHFNTFMNLAPEFRELQEAEKTGSMFTYGLSEVIPSEGLALYLGGLDLRAEWDNALATLGRLHPAYGVILEGLLRAQIGRLFGADVSLENDIYPLFKNEYGLTFSLREGQMRAELILAHDDRALMEEKMEKLSQGFALLSAQLIPRIKETPLPDGTLSREVIADEDALKTARETYVNYKIDCVEIKKSVAGFCYALSDGLLVLGTDLTGVRDTIAAQIGKKTALAGHPPFREALGNLSKVSDEITFISVANLLPAMTGTEWGRFAQPYLDSFDSATWVKHQFDDGVSTEGYVLLK